MAKLTDISINDTGALVLPDGLGKDRPGYTVQVFTEGTGSFTIPTGVSEVDVLVVAGGGGSAGIGGGGGGGGMIERPGYPVTPGGSVPYSVGAGGSSGGNYPGPAAGNGANSVFGGLTAVGGGGSGSWNNSSPSPGGSGSGGVGSPGTGRDGGTGTQPSQPGDSGAYGYGFPGARGGTNPGSNSTTGAGTYTGGGGGGAGGAGGHPSRTGPGDTSQDNIAGRQGGAGRSSSITGVPVFYAGGGGGGSHQDGYRSPISTSGGGIGGGGKGASVDWMYDRMGILNYRKDVQNQSRTYGGSNPRWESDDGIGQGEPGRRNSGGGAGGGYYTASGTGAGGTGGPGIIIVKYRNPVQTTVINEISESTILTCSSPHNSQTDEVFVPTTSGNGLISGSKYYIVAIESSTQFKVSTAKGGTPLQLTNGSSLGISGTIFTAEAVAGMTRFNNEEGHLEIYDGNRWRPLKRTIIEFKDTGVHHFKVPEGVTNVDVLVVAGGGSGGELGGGGGAGGLIYEENVPVSPGGVVPIHVGSGGWHEMTHRANHGIRQGQPSWFGGYEAYGGGGGASHPAAARSQPATHNWWDNWSDAGGKAGMGGSGGGTMYNNPGLWNYGTPGQGNRGGDSPGSNPHANGGGGGAGARGNDATPGGVGGDGGAGREIFITGQPVHYAGGGGGGAHAPTGAVAGNGGLGGGGGGGRLNNWGNVGALEASHRATAGDYGAPGKDNTGGGGGASGHNQSNPYGVGGNGGPGIVIVRY